MNWKEKIQGWIHLLEIQPEPQDTTQLEQWLDAAEDLADEFGFDDTENVLVEEILSGYEEVWRDLLGLAKTDQISIEQMDELCSRPQMEQRTAAWYLQMGTILSASELGALFGGPKVRSALVMSKVNPQPRPPQALAVESGSMSAFDWGIRFEPVVKDIFNYKYGTTIKELGRLVNPHDNRCSASPDGLIYSDPSNQKTGRLIEIKCPVTRQPDGKVPKDYYNQIQMQLHVTGLESCDYVEAVFNSPYSSPLKRDGPGLYKGEIALVEHVDMEGARTRRYEYGPVNVTDNWLHLQEGDILIELIPWSLYQWHEQVVMASDIWWPTIQPTINAFWADVERARADPSFLDLKKPEQQDRCLIRI
jgi:hypothetical protein